MSDSDKLLFWLNGEVKSPPFSKKARLEAGFLLRKLQQGINLSMPESRPMTNIGKHCHELRIPDGDKTWRVIYRLDEDAVVIAEVFQKRTRKTPKTVVDICERRLKDYDNACC
jgi:phage-related protein